MIKIDAEKFDKMLEKELLKNEEYLSIRKLIKECSQIDSEIMATFLFEHSETMFKKGFIEGINFVISAQNNTLFNKEETHSNW